MTNTSEGQMGKLRTVGISLPIIWNNSEATYYQLGNPKYPKGKGISFGINLNHSRTIYKNLYGVIGIGYFKQTFGIIRPFRYDSQLAFGFSTDSYKYDNIQFYGGLGYKLKATKVLLINGNIIYNQFYSFRQKYINHSPVEAQINHKFISIGRLLNITIGIERNISKKFSIGVDALIPISTHWNNDEIFYNLGYATDEQQIGRTKSSIGVSVTCNYHF